MVVLNTVGTPKIANLVYNVVLLGFVADISILRRGSKHYKPLISWGGPHLVRVCCNGASFVGTTKKHNYPLVN